MKNVLIIGFGSIARKHVQALQSMNEQFDVYALRSQPNSTIEAGVTNIYRLDEITVNIDFAIISNSTFLHAGAIEELLKKKCPLFIEKPPLDSLKDSTSLVAKVDESGVLTYVACNLRFHPCLDFLKTYLERTPHRPINEVNVYCGSYLPDWRPNQDFRKIYSANKDMGGGVHLDLFHEIDYTHWLFGTPIAAQCLKRSASTLEIDAVDYANYQLHYGSFAANVILNYYRKDAKRTIEVLFEDGTWTIDLIHHVIFNEHKEEIFRASGFSVQQTYKDQMQYFLKCLNENKVPMNSFAESIETLKTCLCDE